MDKFETAFNGAHETRFDRFTFNNPDYDMLVVHDEDDYLEHLRVQGAGLAYYTALAKQAERDYEDCERHLRFRYNEMYAECSDTLARAGKKNNVRDIEAFVQTKYESELARRYATLGDLRKQKDYINAFLEGWRQKSYILSAMNGLVAAGLLTPREAVTQDDVDNQRIARDILSKRKKQTEGGMET